MQNFISRIGQGGGGGGDAGAGEMWGIDTSRVLKDATTVTSSAPFTYTATENCWARVNSSVQNGATMLVYIDNVPLGRGYSASSMIQWMNIFPLLKGQILRVTTTYDGVPGNVVIYGSKTASGESGSGGHIYSTKEHIIGKWLDGRDIFERTFIKPQTFTIQSLSTLQQLTGLGNITLINSEIMQLSPNRHFRNLNDWVENGNYMIYNNRGTALTMTNPTYTLQYVKN